MITPPDEIPGWFVPAILGFWTLVYLLLLLVIIR